MTKSSVTVLVSSLMEQGRISGTNPVVYLNVIPTVCSKSNRKNKLDTRSRFTTGLVCHFALNCFLNSLDIFLDLFKSMEKMATKQHILAVNMCSNHCVA